MRIVLTVLMFVGFWPSSAAAAPNDFRVISGTLLHPETLGAGITVIVLKSDEGAVYYADLRAVPGIPALQRGAVMTVAGFEGNRPDQLVIQVIYPADVASADAPSERSHRIDGRLGSLGGPTVVVQGADGSEVTMLLRGVSATIRSLLRPGDVVTVFGQPGDTDFVVTGIIQRQD